MILFVIMKNKKKPKWPQLGKNKALGILDISIQLNIKQPL